MPGRANYSTQALIVTSRAISDRGLRVLDGFARDTNPTASVVDGGRPGSFRLQQSCTAGTPSEARAELYRTTARLMCEAGLDIVEAETDVKELDRELTGVPAG